MLTLLYLVMEFGNIYLKVRRRMVRISLVAVPASILLDQKLTASTKMVWIYLRFAAPIPPGQAPLADLTRTLVEGNSGLTRPTIRSGLAELATRGWLWNGENRPERWAYLPGDLLVDTQIGTRERLVYGVLQLTPGFADPRGHFGFPELSAMGGVSINTLKPAIWTLQDRGWLRAARTSRYSPIRFDLCNPVAERCESMIADISQRLADAKHHGEALMRAHLTLIVASDNYQDDTSPAYLRNPFSGELMQFDRLYQPNVAFEYNGAQHYGPTDKYPSATKAAKQRARDAIKHTICESEGIHLIIVHAEDLTLSTMREKVGSLLKLRNLDGLERVIESLDEMSWAYQGTVGKSPKSTVGKTPKSTTARRKQ